LNKIIEIMGSPMKNEANAKTIFVN
jgi:hypothetical protein